MANLKKPNNHQQNKTLDNLPKLAISILNNWPIVCKANKDTTYAVGLSGGVDSVVLLHIFKLLQHEFEFNLQAIHINHNISINALQWQNFCEQLCHQLNIPLTIFQHYVTKNGGESLENNARKLRYQSFTEFYEKYQNNNTDNVSYSKHKLQDNVDAPPHANLIILLAHHQNDQIETVLSQILRGSDLHNIAAMQLISQKKTNLQLFWRPFLNIPKQEIVAYAEQYNLEYIEDESNTDITYLRNFLRQDILPRIQQWDPQINNKILKFNHYIKNAVALIDELAQMDFINTITNHPNDVANNVNDINSHLHLANYKLDVTKFKQLSEPRQHNLISHFILLHQKPLPSYKQIHEFCRQVIESAWDSTPELKLSTTCSIKKYKNHILIG